MVLSTREGSGEMIKAPISLQDLRRRIYAKAKAEPSWRFWGLYVHVCRMETLRTAYAMAKKNDGAPGIDGVTFEVIETGGVDVFLGQLRDELVSFQYRAMRNRRKQIPKEGGKTRVLSIPSIRDRVVQGALKLILEPIFEANFQDGSFGYRPKRTAHDAVDRVAKAIVLGKTLVIDVDLRAYFDNVQHSTLLAKVARRVNDDDVMHLLRMILKASGDRGVPQGGVISPVLSNLYLDEVDQMLERAREVTRGRVRTRVQYARYADDLVVLLDPDPRQAWLREAVVKRLREEFGKLDVEMNEEKSRIVDLTTGESFGFLGFEFRRIRALVRQVAAAVRAKAEQANGSAAQAQGGFPRLHLSASESGYSCHQPDSTRLGELLPRGELEALLRLRSPLGRAEGAPALDAKPEAQGLRLEEVE
jgi:RNA-directed DNA polymerase